MSHDERLRAAHLSLEGLSVGDALGSQANVATSPAPWPYTDDTEMAIAIYDVLREHRRIEQDALARAFAHRFELAPERGYGAGAYWLLYQLSVGKDWRSASRELFRGGSFGNGGAMRVGPVGAYFAGDIGVVVDQARLSAEVTHAHQEGQAGAIAVAVAAAHACSRRGGGDAPTADALFDELLARTPVGPTRNGIERASALGAIDPREAARILGDGSEITSADTVPFALWCAARHMNSCAEALEASLAGCGRKEADTDTICAIVGSIVVLSAGLESIPSVWRSSRESLPV